MHRYRLLIFKISLLFTVVLSSSITAQTNCVIIGSIANYQTEQPVSFCSIQIVNSNMGSMSNENGVFKLAARCGEQVQLKFSCLSYMSYDTTFIVSSSNPLKIKLKPLSLALPDIKVIANIDDHIGSISKIEQAAIQQIQPSGLTELLQLLPGNQIEDPQFDTPNSISFRQVGSDFNTSIGASIVMDGIPMTEDGNMQEPYISNGTSSENSMTGKGLDLRQISTDEIESVEVIAGIPSVKYGDLTSGVVIINRKIGVSPWETRLKTDIKNKLFAVNKGIALPRKGGVLNVGVNYLKYVGEPRDSRNNYQRITSSIRHKKSFYINDKVLTTRTNLSFINTLDKEKEDSEINSAAKDLYKNDYKKVSVSLLTDYYLNKKILDKISLDLSVSGTKNIVVEDKLVSIGGAAPQPISTTEGVAKGAYLPPQYQSDMRIEGKPLGIYAKFELNKKVNTKGVSHLLTFGANYSLVKNKGKGEIYDITRPPFYSKGTRPRDFSSIPSLQKIFFYTEDQFVFSAGDWHFTNQIGVRSNQLLNVNDKYSLKGKMYFDPRVNLSAKLPVFKLGGHALDVNFSLGYGMHTKLPISHQLNTYPVYIDLIELNYFTQNPDLRTLYTRTYINDITNYNLKPSRNEKKEFSINGAWKGYKVKMTLFNEFSISGYSGSRYYKAFNYDKYDPLSVPSEGLTEPPSLQEFSFEKASEFSYLVTSDNSASIVKKGVEYSIELPKINPIKTRVSVNGAWLKTKYGKSVPSQYHPTVVLNSQQYPYVGVYDAGANLRERFNSNFRFDTHIPLLRLICSINAQCIWYSNKSWTFSPETPRYYFDKKGEKYQYTEEDKEHVILQYLTRYHSSTYYNKDKVPFSLDMHIKMTKEIGENIKVAFYVNRFLSYYEPYSTISGQYLTRNTETTHGPKSPYFGVELKMNFK